MTGGRDGLCFYSASMLQTPINKIKGNYSTVANTKLYHGAAKTTSALLEKQEGQNC